MANIRSVVQVAVSGTAARSTSLPLGFVHLLSATTDLYFIQGDSAVTVTAGTGMFLRSGAILAIKPDEADESYVSAIQVSASGTLTIARAGNE